jgi:hypothetical protein
MYRRRFRPLVITCLPLLAALLALAASVGTASAAGFHYVRVTPGNFNAIFSVQTTLPTSSYRFVTGPAKPPLGRGSLELTTVDSSGHQQHLETQQRGAPIASVSQMGYWTYRHPESTGNPLVVAALNMEVLTNPSGSGGTFGYTTLVFEPIYNQPPPVTSGSWQAWDAFRSGTALWWSTHAIPGVCAQLCLVPWSVIVATNPQAVVFSYGVNQGSTNPGITSNVDALYIATHTDAWVYDFEPGSARCEGDCGGDSGGGGND